jgi:hypothetical protein
MNVFGDKRFLYLVVAVIVPVLVVAIWSQVKTEAPPSPAATSAPATTPEAPATTAPTSPPSPAPEAPAKP